MIPPTRLGELHMDPPDPVPGFYDGGMLRSLPEAVVDALVEAVGRADQTALLWIEMRHLGGALGKAAPGHGAAGTLDGKSRFSLGLAMTPEMGAAAHADIERVRQVFTPADAGRTYFNFSDHGVEPSALFQAETLGRLQAMKREVDPDDLFHACHPVAPA